MNTGGPAFPGTLLDWYAGQEAIGDEELDWPICEHFAGPRPTGNWQTNPVEWREWEARWRAGIKYTRATAMLAEKARREAAVKESSTTADVGKAAELEAANTMLKGEVERLRTELYQLTDSQAKVESASRELVNALSWVSRTIATTADHKSKVALTLILREVDAVLAKHKGEK